MTISWDFNATTLLAFGVQAVTQAVLLIIFLVRTDFRVKSAREVADSAKKSADEAHNKIAMQDSAHALFREQVAREYVSREALREMEDRLAGSIKEIRERLDRVLDHRQAK